MVDWKRVYENWQNVTEEDKQRIYELFQEKEDAVRDEYFEKEPYAKRIYDEFYIPELEQAAREAEEFFREEVAKKAAVAPIEKPKPVIVPLEQLKLGEEIKTGPRFKPGDKVTYRWTGEEYTIKAVANWPSVLVEDKYGHLLAKDEFQMVTAEEYAKLKEEEQKKRAETKAAAPRVAAPRAPTYMTERTREQVLRDIFYATLSEHGTPIKDGYRARWRIKLPELLKIANREEQEGAAKDFAMSIVSEYEAEVKARREGLFRPRVDREARRISAVGLPGGPAFEPGAMGFAEPATTPILQKMVKRRCNHPDHEKQEWIRANPKVEAEFPGGLFMANVEEERAAFNLPVPGYFRDRRFNGYCPHHRWVVYRAYMTTVAHWIEVYMWMYKVSGARQGLDPGVVSAAGLDPEKYDKPVSWHPPRAVFEYWKGIGWRAPEKIETVWESETPPQVEEDVKLPFWQRPNWWQEL